MLFVPLPVMLSHAVLRLCRRTIACKCLRKRKYILVYKDQFMPTHSPLLMYILITYLLQSSDMEYHTIMRDLTFEFEIINIAPFVGFRNTIWGILQLNWHKIYLAIYLPDMSFQVLLNLKNNTCILQQILWEKSIILLLLSFCFHFPSLSVSGSLTPPLFALVHFIDIVLLHF